MVNVLNTGIGMSAEKDSLKAGKLAAKMALDEIKVKPNLLIVLASSIYDQNKLMKGITSVSGKTPMIGGTTAGEISNQGFSQNSVVIMALQSKSLKFITGIGKNISKGEKKAGIELINSIKKKNKSLKNAKSLVIFNDALAGDGLEIIKGIQSKLGEDFEIVGGALGDDAKFKKTFQYFNGKVLTNSVVGFMLFGNVFTTTGVMSGWESVGNRIKCTSSKGNIVKEFDNKPALDVYCDLLGKSRAKKLPAIGLEYPMGLIDVRSKIKGKEYFQIRCPLSVDWKKKTVTMAAAIPEGSDVTLTLASRKEVIKGSESSAKQAKELLKGKKPLAIFMFSCVARKMVLGKKTNKEVEVVRKVLGEKVPIFGFYTYGEIGPIDKRKNSLKQTRWHNETVVLWVIAK